jgi:hypothetical protein
VLARLDWTPSQTAIGNVVASVRSNKTRASFVGPTAVPAHGGDVTRSGGDLMGQFSALIHKSILNDSASARTARTTPHTSRCRTRGVRHVAVLRQHRGTQLLVFRRQFQPAASIRTSGAELLNQTTWNTSMPHRSASPPTPASMRSLSTSGNKLGSYLFDRRFPGKSRRPLRARCLADIAPSVQAGALAIATSGAPATG